MGNCVPAQKSTDPAIKLKCSADPQGNTVQSESGIKNNAVNGDPSMAELNSKPQSSSLIPYEASFRDLSNREERFFDSQPWLESDCEDFLSIGDFTPSRGTTPIHQGSFAETPQSDESLYISNMANLVPEPPPTDVKKQLIDLFRDSFSDEPDDDNQNSQYREKAKAVSFYLPPKCTNEIPYESAASSVCSSEPTPNRHSKPGKQKPVHAAPRCLPNLVRSLSFSDRKSRLSPAHSGGR